MDRSADSQAIERIAADWLARRDGDSWSTADETAFNAWQGESMLHRVAVIRLKTLWQHADRLKALGAGVPAGNVPPPGQWRIAPLFDRGPATRSGAVGSAAAAGRNSAFRVPRARHVAAGIAVILFVAAAGYFEYSRLLDPNAYHTAVGGMKALSLADGSQVTLNTDSRIQVSLTQSERRIELGRGEAFFEVAKDPARPFVVQAGSRRIVAVGTKFSVLRDEGDEIRVVVTEGRVRIEERGASAEPPVQLAAGSIARAGAAGVVVTERTVPEAEQTLSWRSGYIMLRDTALGDAVDEFNRYNERQLVIADPALEHLRIGGNLRLTNLDAFVRVLEEGFPVRAENQGNRVVLSAR